MQKLLVESFVKLEYYFVIVSNIIYSLFIKILLLSFW